ncbi:MAG TPA: hypothetical protein VH475_20800 [Tepidisphaeraceae bacterium]|jgi:hypothetical protein
MDAESSEQFSISTPGGRVAQPRDVDTVPYVELTDGRLQGVVSSGSDVERVYCAFIEAGTLVYYSSTNNDRPDAGTAKRLGWLLEAAIAQYGVDRVLRYLQIALDPAKLKRPAADVLAEVSRRGSLRKENAGLVFSRFLKYLKYVELRPPSGPMPEMTWFVG